MKTLYTIIYTSISSVSHERINLGLLMFQEEGRAIFKYSMEKLSLLRHLAPEEAYKLTSFQLKTLENQFKGDLGLKLKFRNIKTEFIQYLSNYANNLISFSPPKEIDLSVDELTFNNLFGQFVFKTEKPTSQIKSMSNPLIEAKRSLIPKVIERVNVDYHLKASEFDFMVFNLHVDMIGKNDVPVLTQFMDFEIGADSIKHRINDYVSIIKPFEIREGKVGKFFIVAQEPNKDFRKQHIIWENLLNSPLVSRSIVQIVPPNELDEVQEYFEKHNVKPFEETENLS